MSFLDAVGLSLLVVGARRLRGLGGELVLRRPHRAVRRLLALVGNEVALSVEEETAWPGPSPEVAEICSTAIAAAIRIGRATMGHVQLSDAAGALHVVAERNVPPATLDYFEVVDHTECAAGAAWAVGNAVYVPDVMGSPIFLGAPSLEVVGDAGIRSIGAVPLWGLEGQAVGMLVVHRDRVGEWSREQRRQLRALASATGRVLAGQERRTTLAPSMSTGVPPGAVTRDRHGRAEPGRRPERGTGDVGGSRRDDRGDAHTVQDLRP